MRKLLIISIFSCALMAQNHTVQLIGSNLMWENSVHSRDIKLSHTKALAYCKDIKTDTFQDWRLPTLSELLSLVDYTKSRPAIKKEVTFFTQDKMYWSTTPYVDESHGFWGVTYKDGATKGSSSHYDRYVRCVRVTKQKKEEPKDAQAKKIVIK